MRHAQVRLEQSSVGCAACWVSPTHRPHLLRALAQAHAWRDALLERSAAGARHIRPSSRPRGTAISRRAPDHRRRRHRPTRQPPAAPGVPSPRITAAVPTGALAPRITLQDLLTAAAHHDWDRQAATLGL